MSGKLVVLEGIDGSGKSTQYKKLKERLTDEKCIFETLVFPRYQNESSALVRLYLGGEFGKKPEDVNAFAASSFYSVDRYASFKTDWGKYYQDGGAVLSDRYTTSNAVHQGGKLSRVEREAYFDWLYDFEFGKLGLPKPTKVLYLSIDAEVSLKHMREREKETNTTADIHETAADYLRQCTEAGLHACEYFGWTKIDCLADNKMRSIEDIHQDIYKNVIEIFRS